jgi:hypothetical protein
LVHQTCSLHFCLDLIMELTATRHTNHMTSSSLCVHLEVLCLCWKT